MLSQHWTLIQFSQKSLLSKFHLQMQAEAMVANALQYQPCQSRSILYFGSEHAQGLGISATSDCVGSAVARQGILRSLDNNLHGDLSN